MQRFILSIVIPFFTVVTQAQMDLPAEGGNIRAMISEEVGITSITIKYSRPGVKGREGKIWGTVVPMGFSAFNALTGSQSSPWRAGANEATMISFEHDIKLEGKDVKAGSYAVFMAMGTDSVTLILSKQAEAWGSFFYKEEDDVLRVKVKPVATQQFVERLKYEFADHQENSCVITMLWEKLSVPFKVEVDVDNIVIDRVREQLTGVKGFLGANMIHASRYFFMKNTHLEEALEWAQRAVTGKPMSQTGYDSYRNLAMGYEKLNHLPQADSVMNVGLIIANHNQHVGYGRTLLIQKRKDKALEILLAAKEKYGDTYLVNNALAYAYSAKGDYKKALSFANKALTQASTSQAKTIVTAMIEKLKAGKDIN